jgi:hypothetical protein
MTARGFTASLRRRWYVLAIVMLCTMAAVWAVHKRSITYQVCDAVFVTAPRTHTNPNVYTNENGALVATAGVVTDAVMSSAVQAQLRSEGLTADYDAAVINTGSNENPSYGEPTLQICSNSTSPTLALRTTAAVTAQFRTILYERQAAQHAAKDTLITATVIASPAPDPIYGRPSQAYIGVGFLGLIIGVALAVWSDQLLQRRRRRKTTISQQPRTTAGSHR